jgi:hypothetical protein
MNVKPDRGPPGPPLPLRSVSGPGGPRSNDNDEYFDQDEDERENAGRRKSLIALAVLAVLVIAGLVLVDRLRSVSALQDCLMTRATNCAEVTPPAP